MRGSSQTMRIWHQSIIPHLPLQWLLAQHREIAALRGKGWMKKHSEVNYVFHFSMERLVAFHHIVMEELMKRGIQVDRRWLDCNYRGKALGTRSTCSREKVGAILSWSRKKRIPIYPMHTKRFLCKDLLDLEERIPKYNERMKQRSSRFKPVSLSFVDACRSRYGCACLFQQNTEMLLSNTRHSFPRRSSASPRIPGCGSARSPAFPPIPPSHAERTPPPFPESGCPASEACWCPIA